MIMRFEVANAVADTVNPEFEQVVRTMERATELGGMTGGKKAADEAAAADLIINPNAPGSFLPYYPPAENTV